MTISEMIKVLTEIKEKEGDLRVTVFDEYTANEGWDFRNEELWLTADASVDKVRDDHSNVLEKVVRIG